MKIKVTYLEMFARPERVVPPPRDGIVVVHARKPTVAYGQYTDDAVTEPEDEEWVMREWKRFRGVIP
jgi:hypothetical protein